MKEKKESKNRLQYKYVQRILILVQLYSIDEISLVNGHVKGKREGQTSTTKLALIPVVAVCIEMCRGLCTSYVLPYPNQNTFMYASVFCT